MKLIVGYAFCQWACLSALYPLVSANTMRGVDLPPNHPMSGVVEQFGQHFRCPYAKEWITKGPAKAASDMGLTHDHTMASSAHRLQENEDDMLVGSCSYENPFSKEPTCVEMRGAAWTTESAETRCSELGGTVSPYVPCTLPETSFAGWCIVRNPDGTIEGNPLSLSESMGCPAMQGLCESMMRGEFQASEECTTDSETSEITCEIAPGPIGAAHQAVFSGYRTNCKGTPAEGSPYMWPLRWSASVESKSMMFGSDDVIYHSKGTVNYMLDKNWKRADWTYQRGVQRTLGQMPCDPENIVSAEGEAVQACRRDSDRRTTMIHRGSKMIFIKWNSNDTLVDDLANIKECNWLDLAVIGNIRPDWFMDARGDATDVQYLGNQHVFYENKPKLMKQWRKKDFADQYFVMSMLENPENDGIHWPMILNVPGEGFGDDFLQHYSNHSLLSDDDSDLFLLDQILEEVGGSCPQLDMGEHGGSGPPVLEEPIPSNLEIDPNSWFTKVYTFSPVWTPPVTTATEPQANEAVDTAITEAGRAVVESCFDSGSSSVQLSITFNGFDDKRELPWIAVGYRKDEECLMTPRDGGDTDMILITHDGEEHLSASFGPLTSSVKQFDLTIIDSVYEGLAPFGSVEGFSDVNVTMLDWSTSGAVAISKSGASPGSLQVQLNFKQYVEQIPEMMHLMYAIGSSPEFGYHSTRMCFDIEQFPACPEKMESGADTVDDADAARKMDMEPEGESEMDSPTHSATEINDTSATSALGFGFLSLSLLLMGGLSILV